MHNKFIKKINLYWGLISIILVTTICSLVITMGPNTELGNILAVDAVIELISSVAFFWGFYLLRFLFKKTKYSFVTCDPYEVENHLLGFAANWKWFWTIFIPIFLAVLIPTIYFASVGAATEGNIFIGWRVLLFFTIISLSSFNNLIYIFIVKREREKIYRELDTINIEK